MKTSFKATEFAWTIATDTPLKRLVAAVRGLAPNQVLTVSGKGLDTGGLQRQLYALVGRTRGRCLQTHKNAVGLEVRMIEK